MSSKKPEDFEDDDNVDQEIDDSFAANRDVILQLQQDLDARIADVRALCSRGDVAEAVIRCLDNPPTGKGIDSIKEANLQNVMEVLGLVKPADIPSIIRTLNPFQLDTLMKFIYRGQMNPEFFNAGILLAWHERVLEVAGLGSIVRVLTDRMTV